MKKQTKSELVGVINDKLKELGVASHRLTEEKATEKYTRLETVHIIPKGLGLMAPVFKEIEMEIQTGIQDGMAGIVLHYSWQHPRGSNGYRIQYVYSDGQWTDMS